MHTTTHRQEWRRKVQALAFGDQTEPPFAPCDVHGIDHNDRIRNNSCFVSALRYGYDYMTFYWAAAGSQYLMVHDLSFDAHCAALWGAHAGGRFWLWRALMRERTLIYNVACLCLASFAPRLMRFALRTGAYVPSCVYSICTALVGGRARCVHARSVRALLAANPPMLTSLGLDYTALRRQIKQLWEHAKTLRGLRAMRPLVARVHQSLIPR